MFTTVVTQGVAVLTEWLRTSSCMNVVTCMLDILVTPLGPGLMIVFATSDVPTTKLTMAEYNSHLCSTLP